MPPHPAPPEPDHGVCQRCEETVPRGVLVAGFVRTVDGWREVVWCMRCWRWYHGLPAQPFLNRY